MTTQTEAIQGAIQAIEDAKSTTTGYTGPMPMIVREQCDKALAALRSLPAQAAPDDDRLAALEEFPEGRNHVDLCRYLDKHEETRALQAAKPESVDVEALRRRDDPYKRNEFKYNNGWNDCLDHLTANGYRIVKDGGG